MYNKESEMYGPVKDWWKVFLKERHRRSEVKVYDTSAMVLYRFVQEHRLDVFFPDYMTYEIEVDITGVIITRDRARLALIECKLTPISLRDIGQMLGYSKVARPEYSLLLSPRGLSEGLVRLLQSYRRFDVLDYGNGRRIRLATWSAQRGEIVAETLLPPGEFF